MRISRTTRSCTVHITGYEASAAFAVTHSRRLRSCSVLGGFINPPLPSVLTPTSVQQGSLAPRALPRFIATTSLAAAVSSSADFPEVRLYDLPGSAPKAAGRGRFIQFVGMPLSPCCPYPPRRSDRPPRSARGPSCCLRPEAEGSASGVIFFFRGHHWVH